MNLIQFLPYLRIPNESNRPLSSTKRAVFCCVRMGKREIGQRSAYEKQKSRASEHVLGVCFPDKMFQAGFYKPYTPNPRRSQENFFCSNRYSENVSSQTTPHQTRRMIWRVLRHKMRDRPNPTSHHKECFRNKTVCLIYLQYKPSPRRKSSEIFLLHRKRRVKKETALLNAPRFACESPLSDTGSTIGISDFASRKPPNETVSRRSAVERKDKKGRRTQNELGPASRW